MKLRIRSLQLFLILLFLCAAGCATVTPYPGGDYGTSHPGGEIPDGGAAGTSDGSGAIGVLQVSGPNVFLNGSPATDGALVYLGNSVATGAGSSAKVVFADGGFLQLDANTDPVFEWLEQSKCLLIRILKGQVYLKKSQTCVEGPDISMILNSEVNLNIPPPPAPPEVTVIRGSADIKLPTQRIKLVKGQQLTAIARAPEVRTISPDVVRSVSRWHKDYRFKPIQVRPGLKPDRVTPVPVAPDPVRPRPITPRPVKPPQVKPDAGEPELITPPPITRHPVKPRQVKPESVEPDLAAPEPVIPEQVAPERVRPVPVTSEPVTSDTVTPATATPDSDPAAQSPVLRRPLRMPMGIRGPKSAPTEMQPAPELK